MKGFFSFSSPSRYDKPEAHVIRHFERLGTTIEDPESYQRRFGDVLLEPEQLLAQVKQLGIDEDLVKCYRMIKINFLINFIFVH